jgi:hypothetical protein
MVQLRKQAPQIRRRLDFFFFPLGTSTFLLQVERKKNTNAPSGTSAEETSSSIYKLFS